MKKILLGLALALFATAASAQTVSVLPNAMTQFIDGNGAPYAGGHVFFYVPNTTTLKATWTDPLGTQANSNPLTLDANGRAVIWGSGEYREIVQDLFGNVVWDQLTYAAPVGGGVAGGVTWYGTSTGTANAITLGTATGFTGEDGQQVGFIASATNNASTTINASGFGSLLVQKNSKFGPVALVGGEIITGNLEYATYSASLNSFILLVSDASSEAFISVTSSATTDLGGVTSPNVNVTGTSTITSFGSSASLTSPLYTVTFAGALVLTNSVGLVLPGGANITTAAGDSAVAEYLGGGNWQVISYSRASGLPVVNPAIPTSYIVPWVASGGLPSGISGTSTTAVVTVSAFAGADATAHANIGWTSPISWGVANGNAINGYAGGSTLPNSSTIHFYACQGTVGAGVYASTTVPGTFVAASCPTGYATYARRLFSLQTTGAGALVPIIPEEISGGGFVGYLSTQKLDVAGSLGTNTRTLYTMSVPSGVKVRWLGRWSMGGVDACLMTSPFETDVAVGTASTVPQYDMLTAVTLPGIGTTVTNTSSQIGIRCDAGGVGFSLTTRGYIDDRRS